ncbi:MAG TPA: riboflavin biosynthesis protein RibF [Hyphomonadaceae bacterium]|nr:riboflavin biosynthesis protein RibF [Hyphomonadaceae bacterium]
MTRFALPAPIPASARGASVALGNFDGVHLGHRAVLEAARTASAAHSSLAVAVFEPIPRRFFHPEATPFRLQSSAQRARTLEALGAAHVFEIRFDAPLAQMSDRDFAEKLLVNQIGAVHVSVGADFRFGRGRMGDVDALAHLGRELGFGVTAVAPVGAHGARYSSSAARAALVAGDLTEATSMLGRPWAVEGAVQRGFARGREFGFPTANLALGDYLRPRLGVYAVRVSLEGATHDGVASVGINPTFGALPAPVLEAHLFDFDQYLYGKTIEVHFIAFLRDEAAFDNVEALKAQMARDCDDARAALAKA